MDRRTWWGCKELDMTEQLNINNLRYADDTTLMAESEEELKSLLMKVKALITQLCPTLCNPMDCSLPGSPVHGSLQARILEWIAISFSRGIFLTQGLNLGLLHCRQMLCRLSHGGSPYMYPYMCEYCLLW